MPPLQRLVPLGPRVAVLLLVAPVGVLTGCEAQRDDTGAIESAGRVSVFEVRVGDCFDDHDDEVVRFDAVPCDEPHDNQVFALFDLEGDEWPGDDEATVMSHLGCQERFPAAIGTPLDESVLVSYAIGPGETTWRREDDREVICAAYHRDFEKLDRSVLDSGL